MGGVETMKNGCRPWKISTDSQRQEMGCGCATDEMCLREGQAEVSVAPQDHMTSRDFPVTE